MGIFIALLAVQESHTVHENVFCVCEVCDPCYRLSWKNRASSSTPAGIASKRPSPEKTTEYGDL